MLARQLQTVNAHRALVPDTEEVEVFAVQSAGFGPGPLAQRDDDMTLVLASLKGGAWAIKRGPEQNGGKANNGNRRSGPYPQR